MEANGLIYTHEELDAEYDKLLAIAEKKGASVWQMRVKQQTPHCKFAVLQRKLPEVSVDVTLLVS